MEIGEVIAILLGATAAITALIVVILLVRKACQRRNNKLCDVERKDRQQESIRLVTRKYSVPLSIKSIPFTVPSQVQTGRQSDTTKWANDDSSGGGTSEPSSPTFKRQTSMPDSIGAYSIGTIDPSLYKISDEADNYDIPPDHIGRVWFALQYERETEKLMVTLIKAKNLPSRSGNSVSSCDPFVRIFLLPDERRYIQSKYRRKTCSPKFEESFVFQVSNRAFLDRTLKFIVLDVDRYKRHQFIGVALYPLKEHDITTDDRIVIWRDLEREINEPTSEKGELNMSLCYNNDLERLAVIVYEAKSLKKLDGCSAIDSFVKVTLIMQNKSIKTKRTEIIRKDESPSYNESFTFKLPSTSLDSASINITVMQHIAGHKDKMIGRLVLGSFMFARGKELEHWNEMVANSKEQITHWHYIS